LRSPNFKSERLYYRFRRNVSQRFAPATISSIMAAMAEDKDRAHHDMGGLPAGPVDRSEHEAAFWEKRIDAIMMLLSNKQRRLLRVDELRRGIESLGPDAYDKLSYYERWIASIAGILVEKGVLTQQEIDARIAQLRSRREAKP
jgi:hypothetical protein